MDMGLLILKSLNSLVSRPLVDLKIFDVFVVGNRLTNSMKSPPSTACMPMRIISQY